MKEEKEEEITWENVLYRDVNLDKAINRTYKKITKSKEKEGSADLMKFGWFKKLKVLYFKGKTFFKNYRYRGQNDSKNKSFQPIMMKIKDLNDIDKKQFINRLGAKINDNLLEEKNLQELINQAYDESFENQIQNKDKLIQVKDNQICSLKNELQQFRTNSENSKYIAIDCEFAQNWNKQHTVISISIVNYYGHPILNTLIQPQGHYQINWYQMKIHGIKKEHLIGQPSLQSLENTINDIIKNKIIIGHSIDGDIQAMRNDILLNDSYEVRDISVIRDEMNQKISLKRMSMMYLGEEIQQGNHYSLQDAQTTMKIYRKIQGEIEEKSLV